MRIVLTVPSLEPEFGGPVAKVRSLAVALQRLGHNALVVGVGQRSRDPDGWVGLPELARFHDTPVPGRLRPLRQAIDGADVVHIVGYRDPVGTASAFEARRRGVPFVLEPVGMLGRKFRSLRLKTLWDASLGQIVLRWAEAVIVTSEIERLEVEGVVPCPVLVRPNGVDVDDFVPLPTRGAARSRLGIPLEAPLIVTIGRIIGIKGLPILVSATAKLRGHHLVIAGPDAGDGTLPAVIAQRRELGLEKRVHILERGVWGQEKAELLADADVYCQASSYESFGSAAAEAAAVGLPLVVTDHCGLSQWLHPRASRIVAVGDAGNLAEALDSTLSPVVRRCAREVARDVRRTLSWDTVAKEQVAVYSRCVNGPNPRV